jgi:glycosyltransferase involved in cell wall biosynthesis
MKRNVSVAFYLPGLQVGGAEIHTLMLREGLEARGFSTSLIVYGRGRSPALAEHPGARDAVYVEGTGAASLRSWLNVRAALKASESDVLFAINPTSIITSIAFKRLLRSRMIGIMHTTVPAPKERIRVKPFLLASRFLDEMVYVSSNQRDYWRAQGLKIPDRVIHNGIDLSRFAPSAQGRAEGRRLLKVDENAFVVGVVASLRPEKNHVQLVDAVARLRRQGIPAVCVFVGEGPHRAVIEAYVAMAGMQDHVVFTGEQGDVRPYVYAMDAGVLCSTSVETLSLAALEMLAMGTPVIMSEIGGASEIVRNGINGFLFKPGDTEELVTKLLRLYEPGVRTRLAEAARPSVSSFSFPEMMDQYVSLIMQSVPSEPELVPAPGH